MTTLLIILLLCLIAFVALWSWAMCRAAARADADWEQFVAGGWSEMSQQRPETPSKSFQSANPGAGSGQGFHGLHGALAFLRRIPADRGALGPAAAALFGILGAALLAVPTMSAWGFGAFAISNVGWLMVARTRGQMALQVQHWVFLAASLLGVWNWWLGPLVRG